MVARSIKLHPSLAEPITRVQVLHVTSGIFSISVPGCCELLLGSWTQTPIATQCCWSLQLEITLLSAGRVHLQGPVQHCAEIPALQASYRQYGYIIDEPLPRPISSAERWDAGAKPNVLLKWQHCFKCLHKMAQGLFRFLCMLVHDAVWCYSFFCWSTFVCHE